MLLFGASVGVLAAVVGLFVLFINYRGAAIALAIFGLVWVVIWIRVAKARRKRPDFTKWIPAAGASDDELVDGLRRWSESEGQRVAANPATTETPNLGGLTQGLAKQGHRNLVVWLRTAGVDAEVEPVTIRFEPLPLDGADDRWGNWEGAVDSWDYVGPEDQAVPAEERANQSIWQRIRGWFGMAIGVGLVLAMPAVVGWFLFRSLMALIRTGQPDGCLITAMILVVLSFMPGIWSVFAKQRKHWLVPAAMVIQRARWWQSKHTLELLRPAECAMGVATWPFNSEMMTIAISDGQEVIEHAMFKKSVRFIMGAWTSPLEAPRVDELGDLV